MVIAWAFELTPEGLKRDAEVDRDKSIARTTGKKLDRIILVVLAVALAYFAFDRFVLVPQQRAEELLNLLARVPSLRVTARTSSFSYKGKDIKIADIARDLNVGHVLEGSVRKSGDRVRITAQLIEARSDTHLWSETYDRDIDDIFSIQDEVADG